ncbi:MAG: helix-turn-helix transcriptional regulator [Clostridia bacterium]|nr:helix-turn-helix transcriptional regulator [Clostridia bacterium]
MASRGAFELVDSFTWEKRSKIITRDVHGISGLMNLTYFSHLASEPSTPMHYHQGILEIHCIVKGRSVMRLQRDDHIETLTCTGGEAMAVFPGECHARGNGSHQEPCELYAMQLNLAEADDFLGLNPEKGRALCERLAHMPGRLVRLENADLALMRHAFGLFSTRDAADIDAGVAHLLCFLARFLRLPPVETMMRTPSDERIQRVLDHVEQNISEPFSLATLAGLSGYSLSRFKTRFREETGQTPALYISALRVERAKLELERTDQSITDIAYNLGWSSGNYFCTVFKKLTGVSPLIYRRQNRLEEGDS